MFVERGPLRFVPVDQALDVQPLLPLQGPGELPRLLVGAPVKRLQELWVLQQPDVRNRRLRAAPYPEARVVVPLYRPVHAHRQLP